MSKLTEKLVAELDDCIIENFADIYELEDALEKIERKHDLDDPDVIAAIATCADVAAAQQRLTSRAPGVLAKGLTAALAHGKLRATSELMIRALLEGAQREAAAPASTEPPPKKKPRRALPAFARPARLPALVDAAGREAPAGDVEALLHALAAKPDEAPETAYTGESLARFGRALVLGWLSHGGEPKAAWAAHAAALAPDDATAKDLGMMARELGPRVGQFGKAQVLVDVLAAMNTRAALAALFELATKVKTRSVKERARAAFDAAAKRTGITEHDLADKLIADDAPVGREFAKRLEERMVTGAKMSAVELIENILQRDAVRDRARGIVLGMQVRSRLVTFTIAADGTLVDIDGKALTLPAEATIVVVHPLDLTTAQLAKWRPQIAGPPFAQLDRPVQRFTSTRALAKHLAPLKTGRYAQGQLFALESHGWKRGAVTGGVCSVLARELGGVSVSLELDPGIYLGRGMVRDQRIVAVRVRGEGPPRAMAEIARELATL